MSEEITDGKYIRLLILDYFPDSREDLLELERSERELLGESQGFEVGPYSYTSEVFMEKVLLPSLDVRDVATLMKASRMIEDLLGCDRESVLEMASIRIVDYLLGFPEYWFKFREFAGSNLVEQVSRRGRYFNFDPFSEGV